MQDFAYIPELDAIEAAAKQAFERAKRENVAEAVMLAWVWARCLQPDTTVGVMQDAYNVILELSGLLDIDDKPKDEVLN